MRTVEIQIEPDEFVKLFEECGHDKVWCAIGYLAWWSHQTYPVAKIHLNGYHEIVAVYLREDGARGYVIAAVWHEDHFGFHS